MAPASSPWMKTGVSERAKLSYRPKGGGPCGGRFLSVGLDRVPEIDPRRPWYHLLSPASSRARVAASVFCYSAYTVLRPRKEGAMRVIRKRCLGLDLHKKQITAHLRVHRGSSQEPEELDIRYGTMPDQLERLREWVVEHQVTDVVMEATSVYW